jgi:hypothetical protein
VIERLRELAARPIADRDRGRLLALAAAAILAATALSLVTRPHRTDTAPVSTRPATTTTPAEVAPTPRQHPTARPPVAPVAVVRSARLFLQGYLSFLYGHRGAQAITGATPALRDDLASRVLVVPPAQRRLHGHAIDLTATVAGRGWSVRAMITDGGVADYPIVLGLTRAGGRLLVSGVGG